MQIKMYVEYGYSSNYISTYVEQSINYQNNQNSKVGDIRMNKDEIWLKENGWIVHNVINKKFKWLMNDEDLIQAGFESLIRYRNQVSNNSNGGFDKGIAWGKVWTT